jgi:hypothetical protein
MIQFKATITDADGVAGFYSGEVRKGIVTSTALEWERGSKYLSSQTAAYKLEIEGGTNFELTGDAYRNLDQHGLVPKFELLAALDSALARTVVTIVEAGECVFSALVTSDVTQSCTVYSSSDTDVASILADAEERGDWQMNDGNSLGEVYFGGGASEDITELDLTEFLDQLIAKAIEQLKEEAKAHAYQLACTVASVPKIGELVEGKRFTAADSHQTLRDLVVEARQIVDLIP